MKNVVWLTLGDHHAAAITLALLGRDNQAVLPPEIQKKVFAFFNGGIDLNFDSPRKHRDSRCYSPQIEYDVVLPTLTPKVALG